MIILNEFETVKKIAEGVSFAKMCDGEIRYLFTGKHYYVAPHDDLRHFIKKAVLEESPDFMVGVPPSLFNFAYSPPERQGCWRGLYRDHGKEFEKLLKPRVYGSCFISRMEQVPHVNCPEYWDEVRKIWKGRNVIGVRGEHFSFQEYGIFPKMREIAAPSWDAWSKTNYLIDEVKKEPKGTTVVMSCGVSSVGFAYLLWKLGYHAIDVGRMGRAFLDGSYDGYKKTLRDGKPW